MTDRMREIDVATLTKTSSGVAIVVSDVDLSSESTNRLGITAKVEVAPEADVTASTAFKVDAADRGVIASEICEDASNKVNGTSIGRSSDVAPCRRLRRKPHVDRRRRRHPIAVLTIDRAASCRKHDSNIAEAESDGSSEEDFEEPEERSEVEPAIEEESAGIKDSASEQIKEPFGMVAEIKEGDSSIIDRSLLDRRSLIASKDQLTEVGSASRSGSRLKKRKPKGMLRSTLERKVEAIERIVEDRVEQIWEQNVEKHSWLQPIDAWIVDRCKPSSNYTITHCQGDDRNAAYDFKFTPAAEQDGEPTIVSGTRIDDPSLENRIITQLRRLRDRAGSSPRFEPARMSARLRKQENLRVREEDSPNVLIDPDVLEVKEAKRYDFLDKLRDNVKEKMEDIHRVAIIEANIVLYLYGLNLSKLTPSDIFHRN
jgi:hypothetical protein